MSDVKSHPMMSSTHREKFFHFGVDDHDKVYAATVFAREDAPGSNRWGLSVAFCSHSDQFCRRTGRQVARRRYFQNRDAAVQVDGPDNGDIRSLAMDFASTQVAEVGRN